MNTWKIIDEYTPKCLRLLARETMGGKRIRAISDEEIALKMGKTVVEVKHIYLSDTWDDITVGDMRSFIKACNFDPHDAFRRNKARAYARTPLGKKFTYLRKSPWWEITFKPLIASIQKK